LHPQTDWFVLTAEANPNLDPVTLTNAFRTEGELHIFTSNTAIQSFIRIWKTHLQAKLNSVHSQRATALGVGVTTDTAVKELKNLGMPIQWTLLDVKGDEPRLNGLQWTLAKLEQLNLLPGSPLHLWTKTNSASERILKEFRATRTWSQWQTHVHEVYKLALAESAFPLPIAEALEHNRPICFGVKSAEVLEATVTLLLKHLGVKSAAALPSKVRFCAWEKSALQKAQELCLQPRLQPFNEFEKLISARERDS
jgi:hypothetical protein